MLPHLNSGVLPSGRHPASLSDLRARFVTPFALSATRRSLFEAWSGRYRELRALLPSLVEWVDGSFVTSKLDPGDVDSAVFIRPEEFNALTANEQERVTELVQSEHARGTLKCDTYVVAVVEGDPNDPPVQRYLTLRGYWDWRWGIYRLDSSLTKGYVEVDTDGDGND